MKALLDEMMAPAIAEQLRARSLDVIAVTERTDLRALPDPDLFERAQSERRVMVTYNRDDFLALHREFAASRRTHAGIVIVSPRRFPEGSIGSLVRALSRFLAGDAPYPSFLHWLQ